jgi:PIN domain nuclease of toxin-antitoxin system
LCALIVEVTPEFLLDTHVVVRWLIEPRKLSKDQARVLRSETSRGRPLAIAAMSLLEIATLTASGRIQSTGDPQELLSRLQTSPSVLVLPITFEIAAEFAAIAHSLRDPADRAIVATARVHRLRLITSDQRIMDSKLVSTIS